MDGVSSGEGLDIRMNNSFTPWLLQADPALFCLSPPFTLLFQPFITLCSPFWLFSFYSQPCPVFFSLCLSLLPFMSPTWAPPVWPRACSHFTWAPKRVVTRWCGCVFVSVGRVSWSYNPGVLGFHSSPRKKKKKNWIFLTSFSNNSVI